MSSRPPAEFPLGPFRPYQQNPILRPRGDGWESASVYNPAAIVSDAEVVLLYRAHAEDLVSHVGLATSSDGYEFSRRADPVLSPSEPFFQGRWLAYYGQSDSTLAVAVHEVGAPYDSPDRLSAQGLP